MNKPTQAQLAAYGGVTLTDKRTGNILALHKCDFYYNQIELPHYDEPSCYIVRHLDDVIPHLRSMKNLDKPIVVEGYNDNEPFVPFEKLYLACYCMEELFANYYETEAFETGEGKIEFDGQSYVFFDKLIILEFHHIHYDLLNLWQFDYRGWIDAGYAKELKD